MQTGKLDQQQRCQRHACRAHAITLRGTPRAKRIHGLPDLSVEVIVVLLSYQEFGVSLSPLSLYNPNILQTNPNTFQTQDTVLYGWMNYRSHDLGPHSAPQPSCLYVSDGGTLWRALCMATRSAARGRLVGW